MILEEMTMAEYKKGLKKTTTMLLPYGSVEAHGNHLPLNTDTLIIEEVLKKAAEELPAFVAPPLHYGVCTSTGQHPGTVGITPETLRRLTRDIVTDAHAKGLNKFILISGHGGGIHTFAIKEAAEELVRGIRGIKVAALSIYEILGEDARELAETENDAHAGEMETSLIMYLAPRLVKGTSRKEFPKLPKPIVARDKMRYWKGAVWGDPRKASAEKGEKLFNVMVSSVVKLAGRMESVR